MTVGAVETKRHAVLRMSPRLLRTFRCEPMLNSTQAPWFSGYDLILLGEGAHYTTPTERWALTPAEIGGQFGVHFAVWAPNAKEFSVIGDFNGWNLQSNSLG